MRNILSFEKGHKFTGQEILDWAKYQIENKTSHEKNANRIMRLYSETLVPDRLYFVKSNYETAGVGDFRHEVLVLNCHDQES